jgi:hypothetical protein
MEREKLSPRVAEAEERDEVGSATDSSVVSDSDSISEFDSSDCTYFEEDGRVGHDFELVSGEETTSLGR